MPADLLVKGVAIVDAVDVLLANRARFEPHVPAELRKYLDDPPYAGDWYPVSEFVALCEAIRLGAFSELPPQAAFEMMGAVTVQRDLLGKEEFLLSQEAKARGGAYQGVLKEGLDFVTATRRAIGLWQLYFDHGEHVLDRAGERALRIRLVGADSPSDEICWQVTGYTRAVVLSLGVPGTVEHTSCALHGADECVWTITYEDSLDPKLLDAFGPWG